MSAKTIIMIIQALGQCLALVLSVLVFFGTEDHLMRMLALAIYMKTLSDTFND